MGNEAVSFMFGFGSVCLLASATDHGTHDILLHKDKTARLKNPNRHPSIQILGLSFLILIGFMLITEAAHLSHLVVFDNEIGAIPKGYLYFAIAFSLMVEFFDLRMKKNKTKNEVIEE